MEKQNKNENTVKAEDINQSKPKKVKKHSNAKNMIKVLLAFVAFCMAVMIFTGAWNPFKSTATDEKAVEVYDASTKNQINIAKNMFKELDELYDSDDYALDTEDFGTDASGGCLKQVKNTSASYQDYYDMNFEIYYMKNEDYAKEKFASLKGGFKPTGYNKTHEFKNGKVHILDREGMFVYTIQDDSVVYNAWGTPNDVNYLKQQRFFDDFGIEFKLPTREMK